MSTIDPTKSSSIPPYVPELEPAKSSQKKPDARPIDHEYSSPQAKLGSLFAPAQVAPPLSGPGVMATVFGPKFPDPRKMSDAELSNGIERLGGAIRKAPGKTNEADVKLWGAMVSEAAARTELRMGDRKPVAELTNRELLGQLLAFDAAEASGKPLTSEQKARRNELEKAIEARGKLDLDGELAYFEQVRAQAKRDMTLHCVAATAGAFSLATHVSAPALLASASIVYVKAGEGKKGAAMLEGSLAVASLLPFSHTAAEVTSTTLNAGECATATQEFFHAGHMIHQLEQEKKTKEARAK